MSNFERLFRKYVTNKVIAFYRHSAVLYTIIYTCLANAIAVSFTSLTYSLDFLLDTHLHSALYTHGFAFFGLSLFSILTTGYLVFKKNFCIWSQVSWVILVLYDIFFLAYSYIPGVPEIGFVILSCILSILVFFTISNLISNKFRCKIKI